VAAGDDYNRNTNSYTSINRTNDAYRLAGARVEESIDFGWNVNRQSTFAFAGNPFMTSIHFGALLEANSDIIKGNYQVWTSNSTTTGYTGYNLRLDDMWGLVSNTDLDVVIPPMQSFLIEKHATYVPTETDKLIFNLATDEISATGNSHGRHAPALATDKLTITASNSTASVRTIIAVREGGNDTFCSSDSRKLFTGIDNAPDIYTLKPSDSGFMAVGVNIQGSLSEETRVPVGLSTSYSGEVTLSFSGMDSYDASITLIDTEAIREIDLTGQSTYDYSFNYQPAIANDQAVANESRFFILFAPQNQTGLTGLTTGKVYAFGQDNAIRMISTHPIQQVMLYNMQGKLMHHNPSVEACEYNMKNVATGVYLVKVITGQDAQTIKVIVK
jgi:hypothetical protein